MEINNSAPQYFLFSAAVILIADCQFLTAPSTVTSYLNSEVQFSCGVEAPWILTWEVDGVAARYLGSRNITFNTVTTREDETSTLNVMASLTNNNSEVSCILISIHNGQEVDRATAFLFIQGLLNQPGNISVVSKSYSSIHLQWTPPFSLQVTDSINNNNTMHFVVKIMNKFNGEILYETITQPDYIYQRHDYIHCNEIVFEIAAVNPVGRGAFSEGIEAGFDGPLIGVNPSNQTVAVGEWAVFSCQILCSQNELITWFVNGLPFPSLEREEGAKFQRNPDHVHSHCSNHLIPNSTTHTLSIQLNHSFDDPLSVYCAVVSVCDLNTANCDPVMCFSSIAYMDVTDTTQRKVTEHAKATSNPLKINSFDEEKLASTAFETNSFSDTQKNITVSVALTTIGSVLLLLGAILFILVLTLIIVYKLHHRKGTQVKNHIYEIPTDVCFSSDKAQNENLEPQPQLSHQPTGVEMNPCLAYQTLPCDDSLQLPMPAYQTVTLK